MSPFDPLVQYLLWVHEDLLEHALGTLMGHKMRSIWARVIQKNKKEASKIGGHYFQFTGGARKDFRLITPTTTNNNDNDDECCVLFLNMNSNIATNLTSTVKHNLKANHYETEYLQFIIAAKTCSIPFIMYSRS